MSYQGGWKDLDLLRPLFPGLQPNWVLWIPMKFPKYTSHYAGCFTLTEVSLLRVPGMEYQRMEGWSFPFPPCSGEFESSWVLQYSQHTLCWLLSPSKGGWMAFSPPPFPVIQKLTCYGFLWNFQYTTCSWYLKGYPPPPFRNLNESSWVHNTHNKLLPCCSYWLYLKGWNDGCPFPPPFRNWAAMNCPEYTHMLLHPYWLNLMEGWRSPPPPLLSCYELVGNPEYTHMLLHPYWLNLKGWKDGAPSPLHSL